MADSLPDLLAEHGIRLKRLTPGHQTQITCPRCEGGRTREVSLSVKIDPDGEGATWNCKRGSCGWTGGGKAHSGAGGISVEPARQVQAPPPHTAAQIDNRPEWLWQFFDERNIGAKTVRHFGIYTATRRISDEDKACIVFPFVYRGEVVNRKYRPHPDKNPMLQERNALQTLYNVDALGEAPDEVIFVEGEPDVLAMHECGFPHTVTLKDGAPSAVNHGNDKRFTALATHADLLAKIPRVILAGDMDPPGLVLREELAQRLGRHRCLLVDWPVGCKDACDVLQHHGAEALQAAMAKARPYPIAGLQRLAPGQLLALRDTRPPDVLTIGLQSVDKVLRMPSEGRLIVVTGFPSMGKTSFVRFLMVQTAARHNRRWMVFSPEMQPWEMFMAECAEVLTGMPFWADPVRGCMSEDQVRMAETWLSERMSMLVADSEDEAPTLDWVMDRARYAVLSGDITDLLIDPWNELEQDRGNMSETDFIGRSLQRLKSFGLRHSVNVWIIAHPAKPQQLRNGEKRAVPGPYDIAGSAHWANKTDLGFTLHQPDEVDGAADLHIWKSRHRRWGQRGAIAPMVFDKVVGRYSSSSGNADDPLEPGLF